MMAQNEGDVPVQVKIENGLIEGFRDAEGLELYLGIPFAQPPVGERRWRAPQPAEAWEGVRSTKKFGPRPKPMIQRRQS
ncbi:carboxylesterase family protein [candidate division KSB1 bacterium]|nr:carboxylesterase family protein [candidate division KSB1 bacterium]